MNFPVTPPHSEPRRPPKLARSSKSGPSASPSPAGSVHQSQFWSPGLPDQAPDQIHQVRYVRGKPHPTSDTTDTRTAHENQKTNKEKKMRLPAGSENTPEFNEILRTHDHDGFGNYTPKKNRTVRTTPSTDAGNTEKPNPPAPSEPPTK